ncbi:hypothetical protein I547_5488 [Mycobacterium kansasii 824]|uniref:Uncharacterized protein n=1 Tax=Mycobacterium kansasii TaxID=1768 RepID=A0A1V3XFL0_MYCKA|nr:hypothetical protein I547_5488 [Mycobacterium kansasii 824]OOK73600.1 hypothetical protein BZL30_5038 [Mycobacterium kansasii]OOK77890.1 hypothetical protein BZL29_3753 [Mycobacterium kansasii]
MLSVPVAATEPAPGPEVAVPDGWTAVTCVATARSGLGH